jgi:hypothetical protein
MNCHRDSKFLKAMLIYEMANSFLDAATRSQAAPDSGTQLPDKSPFTDVL